MNNNTRRVAIVTGGGTGIGRAVSIKLAKEGCAVAVVYSRSESDALATVEVIRQSGGEAVAIRADISDDVQVTTMVAEVMKRFGRIDYLVNNAGITRQMRFDDLAAISDDIWDELIAVNLKGTFHCARAVVPY